MKKKFIYVVIAIIIIVAIVVIIKKGRTPNVPNNVNKDISQELKSENIDFDQISIEGDSIKVSYTQPSDFEMEDLFANWAYIMATAVKNASETTIKVILECNFEDGEKVEATASVENILSFINDEISAEEFFSKVKVKPLTQGPVIQEK